MWKYSFRNVESDNNKILYDTLLDFFLQRNGSYFPIKPRKISALYVDLDEDRIPLKFLSDRKIFVTCGTRVEARRKYVIGNERKPTVLPTLIKSRFYLLYEGVHGGAVG